jgi:hypothetical protein
MTDEAEKPQATYLKLNPKVMLVSGEHILSKPICLTLFNEDGSEPDRTPATNDELSLIVKAMLDTLPENMEMRTLLRALEGLNNLAEAAAVSTLQRMFMLVHDEKAVGHLDHDLMCPAVQNYFDENEVKQPAAATDGATMLDQLLTAGKKPH